MDYDMVKTYVRLPHEWQRIASDAAHQMGVYSAAHYMLPGQGFDVDGQTHVSATTRLGFAYTRSSAGISYQDMRDIFSQPGSFVISTTFNPSLYAEKESDGTNMEDDRRLQVLNTPWDQTALKAKATAARTTNQDVSLDSLKKEEDTVKSVLGQGGVALAGTDSPLDNVATALHLNLRAQVEIGKQENWKALQTATLLTARQIGVEKDLGSVEEGKLADLAFIDGDPLGQIKDLAKVAGVMKNGRYYSVDELMQPFLKPAAQSTSAALQQRVLPAKSAQTDKYWWHDPAQLVEDEHK
jgi:hypothetical protein